MLHQGPRSTRHKMAIETATPCTWAETEVTASRRAKPMSRNNGSRISGNRLMRIVPIIRHRPIRDNNSRSLAAPKRMKINMGKSSLISIETTEVIRTTQATWTTCLSLRGTSTRIATRIDWDNTRGTKMPPKLRLVEIAVQSRRAALTEDTIEQLQATSLLLDPSSLILK